MLAAPDRLEHRVREPQPDDLLGAHLPQVVVDPEELRLVDVAVQLGGERPRGLEVVAERLLDDDAGRARQPRLRQPLHDPAEQERRDLEVEDRQLGVPERVRDPLVRGGVAEVPRDVGEPRREAREDVLVELLARAHDRLTRALDETVDRPVVGRHAEDRAVEQAAPLQPVERSEGHHLRQVARDPKHRQPVCPPAFEWRGRASGTGCGRSVATRSPSVELPGPSRERSAMSGLSAMAASVIRPAPGRFASPRASASLRGLRAPQDDGHDAAHGPSSSGGCAGRARIRAGARAGQVGPRYDDDDPVRAVESPAA